MSVKAWRELVTIPTYEVGKPEKSPMFLEKRVYQGSSGVVYPYPVIESISDEKVDKDYQVIWLENEYILVMVLPELGGRIQMAYDKIKQRHFVYYNHVIKPALVGLAGPWISGGIEFNWPQHHRPSTFMPVDTSIEENADGSVTVWVSEMERMFHQKGMAGFTLRPGCAYLEIKGVLYNRTDMPQTFLWWANPAVEVNDAYQSVFPPDINAVFDHGKRAVSSFPIATGTYYKMDYSAGVDISNYRNIPVPTSYMGINSRYDFEGGYENDTKGGMLHVASHHFSPGKKQWTWGNGDFGRAWDRNLTDESTSEERQKWGFKEGGFRPYIELMAGVYTENQPDFTWLMPYEEKQFVQYFMPYRELGVVKQASKDLVFNLTPSPSPKAMGEVSFKVFATNKQDVCIILRNDDGTLYYKKEMTLSPEEVLVETVDVKGSKMNELTFEIVKTFTYGQRIVLSWHAEADDIRPIPDSAEAALLPEQIKTNEQLLITGRHLEQYRHATWIATDYYEEALRRDPNDIRCLNAMGLWFIRKGRFQKAEEYLRKAYKLSINRNPNPYDSEPLYNLALALKYQGKFDEAYEIFWKSTWSKAWADAGYFEAAKISVMQGRYEDALDELNRCLVYGAHNQKALALKAAVLRILGCTDEALALCTAALKTDRFNYGCMYEQYLLTDDEEMLSTMQEMMHDNVENYHELALDYAAAGLTDEFLKVMLMARNRFGHKRQELIFTPMTMYYLGWAYLMKGSEGRAVTCFREAEMTKSDYCFPNRLEDVIVLTIAKKLNPEGARAPYYLGCLYYDKRQYNLAMENWEISSKLDPQFPTVWRNLALGCFNKRVAISNEPIIAMNQQPVITMMERAFHLDETDSRMLMELDQLYKRLQKPHAERLAFLQQYPQLIAQRDDLLLEEITLLNQTGCFEEACQKLEDHCFHPWEGGEGKVSAQYQFCRVEMAKKAIATGDLKELERAVCLLKQCLEYPDNLGEGKLYGAQENDFYYLLGVAYNQLAEANSQRSDLKENALRCWEEATKGPQEPAPAMYYNDAKPDKIFYQGLALRRLGRDGEANGRFYKLVNYGKQHIFEHQTMDYFAVSLPDLLIWDDSLDMKNRIHCLYMLALGYYGLGDMTHVERYLTEVEQLDINHYGTLALRSLMQM